MKSSKCSKNLQDLCNIKSKENPDACVCLWAQSSGSSPAISAEESQKKPKIIIIQHPQEPKESLGTAWLCEQLFPDHMRVVIGLSKPNLSKIVNELGWPEPDPKKWAIVYPKGSDVKRSIGFSLFSPKTANRPTPDSIPNPRELLRSFEGFIFLDGTWSQAKTLWWRNPWVLKSYRLSLHPNFTSLYGKLRKEPQKSYLSTLESIAYLQSLLDQAPQQERLISGFKKILDLHQRTPKRKTNSADPV